MKTFITGAILIMCCLFYLAYVILLANVPLTETQIKVFNYTPLLVLQLSIIIIPKFGIEGNIQRCFIEVSKWIIAYTFLMIILHYIFVINHIYLITGITYAAAAVTTAVIELCGYQHDMFKDED